MRLLAVVLGYALAWTAHTSFIQVDVPAACGCDCCNVVDRRPSEVVSGVHTQCAPNAARGEECTEQCSTAAGDSVLLAAGEVMDAARFCFFECKPAHGFEAPENSACVNLAPDDRKRLRQMQERTGNAVDPAMLAPSQPVAVVPVKAAKPAPVPTTVKVTESSPSFLQVRQDPVVADTQAVAASTIDQATVTRGVAADLRKQQVTKAAAISESAADDGLAELKQIQDDNRRARQAAQRASMSAGDAEAAVLAARKAALEGGVKAGKQAMEEVKAADIKSTQDIAAFRDKMVNKVELKAIAAAAKAAEPYHLGMLRAQNTVAQYTAQAQKDMGLAKGLQADATDLANQANAAPDAVSAQSLYDEAKAKAAEAQQHADSAKSAFATADQMNQDVPKYQGAAQAAAAKAAFDSMPAWQPAPLMPFPAYAAR